MDILKEIRETAKEHGERIAIKSEEESLTYAQLEEYSDESGGMVTAEHA